MRNVLREVDTVTKKVEGAIASTEKIITPVQQTLFKRFPIAATMLVTFGVVATFLGVERMIADIAWLNERPLLILVSGLVALAATGKLYQKLN